MPRFSLKTLLLLPAAVLVLFVLVRAVGEVLDAPRAPSRANACRNQLKQITIALQNYHDVWRSFPPACTYDAKGRPMHSWRVLLLPFLEETVAYQKYDRTQPWNSPYNLRALQTVDASIFHCPASHGQPDEASYLAVVGSETVWPDGQGVRTRQIADGTSRTILLVEVENSGIHWAEPRRLAVCTGPDGHTSGGQKHWDLQRTQAGAIRGRLVLRQPRDIFARDDEYTAAARTAHQKRR